MTERERLIEIIQKSVDGCAEYWASKIADGLIENGIKAPPCEVGDTVYRLNDYEVSEYSWDIISVQDWGDELCFIDDSDNSFSESDIGKTVFLTREEAEKALKEDMKGRDS